MSLSQQNNFSIIAFGKQRGLQLFHHIGFRVGSIDKLIEHLQLDLSEMPLRPRETVFSKILWKERGILYTFFIKYQFTLDAYGRKGFRAIAIGLKGKRLKNWEDSIRLASILRVLPLYEYPVTYYYLSQLEQLPVERIVEHPILLDQLPYLFPAIDNLSELELATFIYISIFEDSQLPSLSRLYLTDSKNILSYLDETISWELVAANDFQRYVESFGFSLYERQSQRINKSNRMKIGSAT